MISRAMADEVGVAWRGVAYFHCTISENRCRIACKPVSVLVLGCGWMRTHSLTSLHSSANDADIMELL